MKRFVEMPFDVKPEADDNYMVVYDKETAKLLGHRHNVISYTKEGGWNTHITFDGECYKDSALDVDELKDAFTCWLMPYTVGINYWFDQIDTIIEEVKGELYTYADRKLTDDEMEQCEKLEELYDLLDKAKDFAKEFR